jgi:hypothetical protein
MATCLRCGNEWTPRKENPKRCPGCQNPNWNRPRKNRRASVAQLAEQVTLNHEVEGSTPSGSTTEPECVRAPVEQDSLSELKARAEALMGKLA